MAKFAAELGLHKVLSFREKTMILSTQPHQKSLEVFVIIATSMGRNSLLLERSLPSVYRQTNVKRSDLKVIIVDDNDLGSDGIPHTFKSIVEGVRNLREKLGLTDEDFETFILPNTRTKYHSGTGSWNTGIRFSFERNAESFTAILDDDDEFLPSHIEDCLEQVKKNSELEAVFQSLAWKDENGIEKGFPLSKKNLTELDFFLGNPGVQGSNMFIKTSSLKAIDGFDESFLGTTDRDLMIRLIRFFKTKTKKGEYQKLIQTIEHTGVIHYNHSKDRVTGPNTRKHKSLDRFYEKYRFHFSYENYLLSLQRASLYFQYEPSLSLKECICICMPMRNNAKTLEASIRSVFSQRHVKRDIFLLISDDMSEDNSIQIVKKMQLLFPNIIFFENSFNSASHNRNWLQFYVQTNIKQCVLLGRLDADDTLASDTILSQIEHVWENEPFDVLLMSNHQVIEGTSTGYTNRPSNDFLTNNVLLERLRKMADGDWEAELPSCNVFVRPEVLVAYPLVESAEDHWNLVEYLLQKNILKISIKPDLVYCNYNILNFVSEKKNKTIRLSCRKKLLLYATRKLEEENRKQRALGLLQRYRSGSYKYLGAGFSGVVFHDDFFVYKVHIPLSTNNFHEIDNILFLKEKKNIFKNRKHFFEIHDLILFEETYILIYPFEHGEKVESLSEEEMVSFLAEMWKMKFVCRSITKENNFMRFHGTVKLIDYEIEPYNDNLFLNTAARAFIQIDNHDLSRLNYDKLKRSTINQFQIEELQGFFDFLCKVFEYATRDFMLPTPSLKKNAPFNMPDNVYYDGKENPSVSLLIKACIQDSATLYEDIQFLVTQLPSCVVFQERLLLLDLYKSDQFLRQYTTKGNEEELLHSANLLLNEGFIDRILIPPHDSDEKKRLHLRWFDVDTLHTHTHTGVPVTSQIWAFEQADSDYILQMDEDLLIGKKNESHDFLRKPLRVFEENTTVVSIGFPIYNPTLAFQNFFGLDGSIPPDVRCCLLHKERLLRSLPFKNSIAKEGWELSWYRSLEKSYSAKNICSLRGGDTETFYVHIQNYRKASRRVWWTIREGVRSLNIPDKQAGKPEVSGHIFDWTAPKRKEPFVVILYVETPNEEEVLQTVCSIFSQNLEDMGCLIYDGTGSSSFRAFLRSLDLGLQKNITIVSSEKKDCYNEALYNSIHYYITDQESFICLMRQGDILLDSSVLSECYSRLQLYQSDLLIGKELSQRTLKHSGLSVSYFLQPRKNTSTLVNGLTIFKKYLFDALSLFDLMFEIEPIETSVANFTKMKNNYSWTHINTSVSVLVPLVELSKNPIRFDNFNVLRKTSFSDSDIETEFSLFERKKPKKEGSWEKGRKTFNPNQNRIEIDITYECNLKCFHCNRSCTQAPTQDSMSFEQIQTFIHASILQEKKWELINILGGEPTLHPDFQKIVLALLQEYVDCHSPKTILQVTSNGYGERVREQLDLLPKHPRLVINTNSFKEGRAVPYFTPFNLAPIDVGSEDEDFSKGCWVTAYCGLGLNHLGYFACAVAGGIERIVQSKKEISSLENVNEEDLRDQLNSYCRFCGNFCDYAPNQGDFMARSEKDIAPTSAMSETWKHAYRKYNETKKKETD